MRVSKLAVSVDFIEQVEVLANRHDVYTEQYVARANDELYLLLADMLTLCRQINSNLHSNAIIADMRKVLREKHGVKTQAKSTASSVIVRFVIKANRKIAHVYGRVLDAALADQINAENLPQYIRDRGGVEAIRKSISQNQQAQKIAERRKAIQASLAMQYKQIGEIGTVTFNDPTYENLAHSHNVEYTYLLCAKVPSKKQLQVLASLPPSQKIEEAALDAIAIYTDAAVYSTDISSFSKHCASAGLNADTAARWLQANGFDSYDRAIAFYNAIGEALKKAA